MASLPLEVHQVLEEEYVSMYGPLDRPTTGVDYDDAQVLSAERVCDALRDCETLGVTKHNVVEKLNALIATDAKPSQLACSAAITAKGSDLLKQYDDLLPKDGAERETAGRELRRTIIDEALPRLVKPLRDVRLDSLYDQIHARKKADQPRTALCISGGGIRSATFALGIIQGLASADILRKFDYLSTVSGGGYIGSWLSSWVRRHPDGIKGVETELYETDTAVAGELRDGKPEKRKAPAVNVDPEPTPVRHLREYSNFLSPRLGLLSADSWTLASHYVRNLLLNLLVLVPLLALALAVPRFFSWGLERNRGSDAQRHLWIALGCATVAFACIGAARPLERGRAVKRRLSTNRGYLIGVVLPLVIAAAALALYWARVANNPKLLAETLSWWHLAGAVFGMVIVPWAFYYGRMFRMQSATPSGASFIWEKMAIELVAVSTALVTAAGLFYLLAMKVFPQPILATPKGAMLSPLERIGLATSPEAQLYACLAVPAALLVFFVQASIFVGLSGRRNEDSDREWWARGGALLLMIAIGIAVFSAIAVFGPLALYRAPVILGSIGGAAGIVAAVLGFSDKTPANQKQKEKGGTTAKLGNASSGLLIPVFVVFVLAAISTGSTWLIQQLQDTPPVDYKQRARDLALQYEYTATQEQVAGDTKIATKSSIPAGPFTTRADLQTFAHLETVKKTTSRQLLWFLGVAAGAGLLSLCIGVNKFSMHALYRNRLIRAYLGASRHRREPDRFTGFDEDDNLQMWELRPEIFWRRDIRDGFPLFLKNAKDDKLASYLWNALDGRTRDRLSGETIDDIGYDLLVQDLNRLVLNHDLAKEAGLEVAPFETEKIGHCLAHRNRELLDRTFAKYLTPMRSGEDRGPLHVINTALNLTTGDNLGWQQRMAESFTISPFHSGSLYAGYRSSHDYGGPRGISLGTAVTISGAAASPNMGYHSSPAMAFILTMFNIRLGSWLGNPGLRGQKSYDKAHPTSNLRPLAHELTGGSNDQAKWIYLTDGGHFENLGLYEMVVRRCHYIVVSDAGADPKFSFEDLGNAIRKIRTDLGVPIDIYDMKMTPRTEEGQYGEGRYVARARIRYSVVDEGGEDGTLIYIKSGIYQGNDLPQDVYNYAQESLLFPHEPTSDQFFSESQFESYRALGRHAINEICANYTPDQTIEPRPDLPRVPIARRYPSIPAFDDAVRAHLS